MLRTNLVSIMMKCTQIYQPDDKASTQNKSKDGGDGDSLRDFSPESAAAMRPFRLASPPEEDRWSAWGGWVWEGTAPPCEFCGSSGGG